MTNNNDELADSVSQIQELIDRLGPERDEVCVISLAAALDEDDQFAELSFASILFGPVEMGDESWPTWSGKSDESMRLLEAQWKTTGLKFDDHRVFFESRDRWFFARWVLSGSDDLALWISNLFSGDALCPEGDTPRLRAHPSAPKALIHTFPLLTSQASLFTLRAERPTTGFLFPLDFGSAALPPTTWTIGGVAFPNAALWLLGLPISDPPLHSVAFNPDSGALPGLFLGRLTRDAWFSGVSADPSSGTVSVRLGMERTNLADLEVDLEEFESGDLANAYRLRLGDIDLPPSPSNGQEVVVNLPTLGAGVHRKLRLFDRDGNLLDTQDRLPTVESVTISVSVEGSPPVELTVGHSLHVDLAERLKRAGEAEAAYVKLLEDGLAGRIIDDPSRGLPKLAALLNESNARLDILDPYFGWNIADWNVLAQVRVPIRVLTHGYHDPSGLLKRQEVLAPPPNIKTAPPSLDVRTWGSGPAPWHDRVYLWEGGGVSVGTSPSGLGKRVARIDRMTAIEAEGWKQLFDSWWSGPDVRVI